MNWDWDYSKKHYQRAIELELKQNNIQFERERRADLIYGKQSIGYYSVDFLIENCVVLEIKAAVHYKKVAYKQAYSYLRQLNAPLAIVVNFHCQSLEYKRIINPLFIKENSDRLESNSKYLIKKT